ANPFQLVILPRLDSIFSLFCSCALHALHSFPTRRSSDLGSKLSHPTIHVCIPLFLFCTFKFLIKRENCHVFIVSLRLPFHHFINDSIIYLLSLSLQTR